MAQPDLLDLGRSWTYYGQAIALAEQLGMRPLVAHCAGTSSRAEAETYFANQAALLSISDLAIRAFVLDAALPGPGPARPSAGSKP